MTDEKIKLYTEKISNANRTEIIILLYDIFLEYMKDAEKNFSDDKMSLFSLSIKRAEMVLMHLEDALDFTYPISNNLYSLYIYCQRRITESIYKRDISHFNEVKKIIISLRESFSEVKKVDTSEPIMKNTEKIVYGMTYGKNDINKMSDNSSDSRGFLA